MKQVMLFLGLIFFAFSCAEVIDLNTETDGGQLIIYGRITNGGMGNSISITRAQPEGQAPASVSGALVTVTDGNGAEELYRESTPGVYVLARNTVVGQVGGTYQLEVVLDGVTYTSNLQEMMPIIAQDELRYELDIEQDVSSTGTEFSNDVVRIFANSTLNSLPDNFYIRWAMEEVYNRDGVDLPVNNFPFYSKMRCYITNELSTDEIFLVDGAAVRNVNLNNREVAVRRIDNTFIGRHYFNIIQFALNEEAHEYWQNLQSITSRQGSIFDVAPAALRGNIVSSDPSEQVFGFFEASAVDTTRLLMTNNDIPIFFAGPCALTTTEEFRIRRLPTMCISCLFEEGILEEECVFCNLLPNSSTVRPSYF